jgi:hypothetical protein
MPRLTKSAPKAEKKARAKAEFDKFGKGTLKSSSGQKVTNPKQATAIALSESGQSRKSKGKPDHDSHMLNKYEHHQSMAQKHRAHADLIEAKLRTQGKRIGYDYGNKSVAPDSSYGKRVIKKDTGSY